MNRIRLSVGNPTGHEDRYSITLAGDDGRFMLRGHMGLRAARELAHLIRRGSQATGTHFTVSIPGGENETTV